MTELCLSLVLVLDPQAAATHAIAAAAAARPCTKVVTLTGKPEADRALVGSVPERVLMVAYGPAAAAAAVGRWPNRELTIGGVGPANAPFFKAAHRRVLSTAPSPEKALGMAVKLLPSRSIWCLPKDVKMARDRLDLARNRLARRGVTLLAYDSKPPAGCQGLVAWFEGPAATPDGLQTLVRTGEALRLPVLGFDTRLLDQGVDLAVGVQMPGYFSVLLGGGELRNHWILHIDPVAARRKGLIWPAAWPNMALQLHPRKLLSMP
jgi:hypothetical protein